MNVHGLSVSGFDRPISVLQKVFPSDCSEASKTQKRSLEEVVDEAKEESAEVGSPSSKRPRSTREVVVVLRRGRSVTTTPD